MGARDTEGKSYSFHFRFYVLEQWLLTTGDFVSQGWHLAMSVGILIIMTEGGITII